MGTKIAIANRTNSIIVQKHVRLQGGSLGAVQSTLGGSCTPGATRTLSPRFRRMSSCAFWLLVRVLVLLRGVIACVA
jgi:hypothetical protein